MRQPADLVSTYCLFLYSQCALALVTVPHLNLHAVTTRRRVSEGKATTKHINGLSTLYRHVPLRYSEVVKSPARSRLMQSVVSRSSFFISSLACPEYSTI